MDLLKIQFGDNIFLEPSRTPYEMQEPLVSVYFSSDSYETHFKAKD